MNNNFADIAEAIAKIQFDCDEAIQKLDIYVKQTEALKDASDQDKQKILDIIVVKKRMVLVYSVNAIHKLK